MFFTTMFILLPIGGILFYQLQSRIGAEQLLNRKKFAEDNPHLERYLRKSVAYQDFYSRWPPPRETNTVGGMTNEQKKNLLKTCG